MPLQTENSGVYVFTTTSLKADLENDTIEGHIATSDPDLYRDIVTGDCMIDLVRQINSGSVKLDFEHENFKSGNPLDMAKNSAGRLVSATLDNKGVYVKAILNRAHQRYQEIRDSLKNGFLDAFSIAYRPIQFSFKSIEGVKHRMLNRVLLLNVALTGIPVNPAASIEKVMLKSIQEEELGMVETEKKAESEKDKKEEEEEEDKKKESTETKSEKENKTEPGIEVKALAEKLSAVQKELAELKAKKEEPKTNEFEFYLKSLEEGLKKVDEIMSKPQFKAVISQAPEEKKFTETQATQVEVKSKGIVSRL